MNLTLRERIEKNSLFFIAGIAIAAFAAGWTAYSQVQRPAERISDLKESIKEKSSQLNDMGQKIERLKTEVGHAKTLLDEKENLNRRLRGQLDALQKQLAEVQQ